MTPVISPSLSALRPSSEYEALDVAPVVNFCWIKDLLEDLHITFAAGRAAAGATGTGADWTTRSCWVECEDEIGKLAHEFWLKEENVLEHICYFSSWVPENRAASICADANVGMFIVDCDPQSCADLFFHELLFVFKGVLLVSSIQLRPPDWWHRYDGERWQYIVSLCYHSYDSQICLPLKSFQT
jgi:hypothetical protein